MTDFVLDAWTTTMWKACWQGSLFVLAVWLICQVIPSMPARCRCWLWRLAILKFIAVLLLPTLVNLPLLPAPTVAAPIPEVSVQIVRQQVPVRRIEPVEIYPSRAVELPSFPAILAFLWIIGVGWSLAHLLVAWQGARRLRKQSRIIDNGPVIEQLAHQARLYGLRTSPRLLETGGSGSPMLIGILRPAIVIPGSTLRRLSPPELAMVLGHELAHIRRGDLLWNLVAAVVRAVFFFHPLVWLSQRRLNLAQEVAADELAILRQRHDPVSYGKLLVSVISKLGPSRLIPTMSMGTAGSVQSLTRRLVAMANIGRASRGIIVTSGILLAAMVLLGIVPWRLVAAEPKVSENQKEPPKVALPAYCIEPPDVIGIEMPKVVPLPSNRAALQPVSGQYLVGPDGTINLRQYGVVVISGKTVVEARTAIENHLKQYLDSPELSVKVVAYNSKVFYVITQEDSSGDEVRRFPATGEERVSDVISLSQTEGLSQLSGKKIWISRPVPHCSGDQQILSVEWNAATQRVQAATNYQILPGDRVYVATPESSSIKTLPDGSNDQVKANYNAYQNIPAGSGGGEEQQVVKPIPPAPPAPGGPRILRENQRLAEIDVWERKGQAKIGIANPNLTYLVGTEANFAAVGDSSRYEIRIHPLSDKKPFQHVIEAKLIRDPKGKNPVTLTLPTLTLNENTRGIVSATEADGSELFVEVTILSSEVRNTLEPPAARQAEVLPAHDQSAAKEGSKAESTPAHTHRLVWEPNTEQQKAIAEIERSGGMVWTYEQSPGKPVIGVYFANKRMIVQGVKNGGPSNFAKVVTFRTNKGLLNIEGVTGMHDLRVTQDSDPDVRESKVTDAGLASLNGLPQVQVVSLWGTQVSDAGLENLKSLTNLTVLDLRETKVTDAGVKKLQQKLPKCKIIPAGTTHPSSIFPDRQSVVAPDRIYDPIPTRPIPTR